MALSAKDKLEIDRKIAAGQPLSGDQYGKISADNLAYYQQQLTAAQAVKQGDLSNQNTGTGVGTPAAPTYPGNDIVPSVTNDAVTGYGFTAIVGLGVAILVVSLLSAFRRVRGR